MGAIQQWFNRCFAAIKTDKKLNQGQQAEAFAASFLQSKGLKLIAKNYRTKLGEIDLIMRDGKTMVFVEVKYRAYADWAHAAETVTMAKQQKIIRTAQLYLQQQRLSDQVDCRFDVLAIDQQLKDDKVRWLKHAFY